MNRTVGLFIPDQANKQKFLHTSTVCAPVWNISHILSSLPQCGLQKNDQCRTISVMHLFLHQIISERNSKVSDRVWWSVRRSWIPENPSLQSFWRTKNNFYVLGLVKQVSSYFELASVATQPYMDISWLIKWGGNWWWVCKELQFTK
jgi:hypothetical protein